MSRSQEANQHAFRVAPRGVRAFSLIEVAVVVAILAALALWVVPRFSPVHSVEDEQALAQNLHYLRGQILIYRDQHHGVAPGYPRGNTNAQPDIDTMVRQLTQYTNQYGDTSEIPSDEFCFGPYMRDIPDNPLRGSRGIQLIAGDELFPATAQGEEGWLYQPQTGQILANVDGTDLNQVAYLDY